jgi:dTDP-4-amino-4,6-dideoxy-D-galactose acyltransferase
MKIETLQWDSSFFGIKIGKLVIDNEINFNPKEFKEQIKDDKFQLVYVFKNREMFTKQNEVDAEIELVDIMLTLSKKFNKEAFLNLPYDFRTKLSKVELNESYLIADTISSVSRFYNEPNIGRAKTNELYRTWIDNALNKTFVDGLFLVKNSECVTGIHLIRTDELNKVGYCSLIGVNSSKKGLGIGKSLWDQACGYWANEKDINLCKVAFSLHNLESFNFHLSLGFNKIDELKYIYHYRSKG